MRVSNETLFDLADRLGFRAMPHNLGGSYRFDQTMPLSVLLTEISPPDDVLAVWPVSVGDTDSRIDQHELIGYHDAMAILEKFAEDDPDIKYVWRYESTAKMLEEARARFEQYEISTEDIKTQFDKLSDGQKAAVVKRMGRYASAHIEGLPLIDQDDEDAALAFDLWTGFDPPRFDNQLAFFKYAVAQVGATFTHPYIDFDKIGDPDGLFDPS